MYFKYVVRYSFTPIIIFFFYKIMFTLRLSKTTFRLIKFNLLQKKKNNVDKVSLSYIDLLMIEFFLQEINKFLKI